MAATLIDGKALAAEIRAALVTRVETLAGQGVTPCLAAVLLGEDPASQTYVRSKLRTAATLGIASRDAILPSTTPEGALLGLIERLNADPEVHGILVQLPLPPHIDTRRVLTAVDPAKDVDGFHPVNVGTLVATGSTPLPPCTPAGCIALIERAGVALQGKEAVVVGRSNIVGKPVAMMLLARHATVTICHSRTRDLAAVCRRAEVLVVAAGRARMIGADHVREGAVVIDVGTNRVDGKLVGDVDLEAVSQQAAAITPVPGGVGPMTIAMLMCNTVRAAELQAGR